ncbi:MAG: hypothetical protein FJ098_15535, partial [Deltaproteobacteria bacterium]|nr:hypothetical protein [Deltaproteobacteria bacterium]
KTFSGLPAHDRLLVTFDYYFIDSWDGESGWVKVDNSTRWSLAHVLSDEADFQVISPCGNGSWGPAEMTTVAVTLIHTGGSVTVQFGSTLDQVPSDESFAVDNVRVIPLTSFAHQLTAADVFGPVAPAAPVVSAIHDGRVDVSWSGAPADRSTDRWFQLLQFDRSGNPAVEAGGLQALAVDGGVAAPLGAIANAAAFTAAFEHKDALSEGRGVVAQVNCTSNTCNPWGDDETYLMAFHGWIWAPEAGIYGFSTNSDDASDLLIDGQVIASFYGTHGSCTIGCTNCTACGSCEYCLNGTRLDGTIFLTRGLHRFTYRFAEGGGGDAYQAFWKTPSGAWGLIPASAFRFNPLVSAAVTTGFQDWFLEQTPDAPGGTDFGWTGSTAYSDTGLSGDTQYCYVVRGRDVAGNSGDSSSSVCVTTPTYCAVPTGLSALAETALPLGALDAGSEAGRITLAWTPQGSTNSWALRQTWPSTQSLGNVTGSSLVRTNLEDGQRYCFQLGCALKDLWTAEVCAVTPDRDPPAAQVLTATPNPGANRTDLSWALPASQVSPTVAILEEVGCPCSWTGAAGSDCFGWWWAQLTAQGLQPTKVSKWDIDTVEEMLRF